MGTDGVSVEAGDWKTGVSLAAGTAVRVGPSEGRAAVFTGIVGMGTLLIVAVGSDGIGVSVLVAVGKGEAGIADGWLTTAVAEMSGVDVSVGVNVAETVLVLGLGCAVGVLTVGLCDAVGVAIPDGVGVTRMVDVGTTSVSVAVGASGDAVKVGAPTVAVGDIPGVNVTLGTSDGVEVLGIIGTGVTVAVCVSEAEGVSVD